MMSGVVKSGFLYTNKDSNVLDSDGNSPLYYAAGFGNLPFCDFLLAIGADPN